MELTLTEFVYWTLGGVFGLVLLAALVSRSLHARTERQALARRVICRLCLHAFEDSSHGATVECPACGALTEKGGRRNFG